MLHLLLVAAAFLLLRRRRRRINKLFVEDTEMEVVKEVGVAEEAAWPVAVEYNAAPAVLLNVNDRHHFQVINRTHFTDGHVAMVLVVGVVVRHLLNLPCHHLLRLRGRATVAVDLPPTVRIPK